MSDIVLPLLGLLLACPPPPPRKCWCAAEVDLSNGGATCDFPCAGDSETTCGGFDAFDLFELEGAVPVVDPTLPTTPLEPYYLGCFADDQDDRVLDGPSTSGDMTLEVNTLLRASPYLTLYVFNTQ